MDSSFASCDGAGRGGGQADGRSTTGSPQRTNYSIPESLGKPVIKHSRIKYSAGKHDMEALTPRGSMMDVDMEESSLLASESSTVKSELLRKWDAERKAKKAEEECFRAFGRRSLRYAMEEKAKQEQQAIEKKRIQEEIRKNSQRLKDLNFQKDLAEACFKETRYEPENNYGIESRIAFFEWLTPQKPPAASKPSKRTLSQASKQAGHSLSARIPDTVIWGLRTDGNPSWFLTTPGGVVKRVEKFTSDDILDRIGNRHAMGALVAVVKRQAALGTDVELLSTVELQELVMSPAKRQGLVAIQRFVKARGRQASFIRTAWYSSMSQKAPKAWMLSNKLPYEADDKNGSGGLGSLLSRKSKHGPSDRFLVNCTKMHSCRVDEIRGILCEDAARLNQTLARFLELERGVALDELIVDYIRDEDGRMWMIQVNAFVVRTLSRRCYKFDRLPGENSQTMKIAKRTARNRPESREPSKEGTGVIDGDPKTLRCTITGVKVADGKDKATTCPRDVLVIQDRRNRRGAREVHILAMAAASARALPPELLDLHEPSCQEVKDLLIAELKVDRLQRELNSMLGVKDVKCTVEHIYKHFETTRRQSDDDLSIAPGSPRSVSTFATAVDELPSGPAALPRDAECFRLLFCPSSFRGLTDSFLDSWIGDAAVAKVEFEAMYQRTTLDHTFMGGADASDCKKLRVLYFWACPSVHRSWLSGPGARLQVKLIDAVTSSGVAGIGLHMGPLLLSSEEALPSPGGSLRKVVSVALSTMNTTDLPSPEVQIIMSLENLGKRKPRRGRLPAHHDGVWIPTPGFSTADPLPGWWMAVIGAGSPARVSEALADWPRSSGGEEGVSFSLGSLAEPFPCKGEQEPSGQQFAGPDDGFVRQEEQVATDVAEEGVTAISGLHPAQALLAAVQAVLDSPEGAASFRAVFEELSEGEGSLRADRLGELASRLLPGAAPWEQQLFQSVVSLCRVEMLNAQHLEAEVRAATASLEDASSADQEMATLAAVVSRIPAYELRRDFAAACQTSAHPSGLDFTGLAVFLQNVLPAASAGAIRQLIMQLCLVGPDGNFCITFDEFRAACEAIPIAENQGLEVDWTETSAFTEDTPGKIPSPGALLVTLVGIQNPQSQSNSDAAVLPAGQPLLLQVFTYFGNQQEPNEPWLVGPIVANEAGEIQVGLETPAKKRSFLLAILNIARLEMIADEGDGTECFLVDGLQFERGDMLPSLELQVLDVEDRSILAVAWCGPQQFSELLDGLHREGVLRHLPAEDRGHCMEQFCALWKPSVDPEKIEVQPEGEDVPRLIIMQEFIPIPSEDGTNESRGSDQQAAESSQVVASLQPSRSQVSMQGPWKNEDAARNIEEPVPRANQISTGDWHDVVTEDSPAAKLLRGAQLGGLVEVMCCQIGAVRQEDLADFHLGLAESASQTDRWEALESWMAEHGSMIAADELQRFKELVDTIPPLHETPVQDVIQELDMVDGRCLHPLADVARGRWISPAVQALLSLGAPELSWEDVVLVEAKELQEEIINAGHTKFEARAVHKLVEDYLKAQLFCDELEAANEAGLNSAEGTPRRDQERTSQAAVSLPSPDKQFETIAEERTEDMEEVEPKPGRVDASQLQPRNDGDDPGQPSPEASDRGPVPDGPPSTHEDAENEVGEISRESSSGVVPPLDVAGGLPMPFHLMGHQSAQHEQPVSDGDESVGHDVPHVSEPSGEPTTFVEPDRSGVPLWLRN